MATITFDTHQFIRTLKDSGIPENQAKAITTAFKAAQAEAQPATETLLEMVKLEIKRDIAETKSELTRWIISAGVLQTALIAGLLLKLMK
jgi:hypothetical protein